MPYGTFRWKYSGLRLRREVRATTLGELSPHDEKMALRESKAR